MKEIPLTQGKIVFVDDEDFVWLNQYKWFARKSSRSAHFYAVSGSPRRNQYYMHRLILGAQGDQEVDHKNHDTLDNRRENLRLCSHSQNMMNQRKIKYHSSEYKGVCWENFTNKWRASIKVNRRAVNLGRFQDAVEAAKAYDAAAIQYFGEFALLNF